MDKVTFIIEALSGVEYAIIDRGNDEFTSMLKSTYDAMQAAQAIPFVPPVTLIPTQPDEADLTEGTN
jgi:hypothetical protein